MNWKIKFICISIFTMMLNSVCTPVLGASKIGDLKDEINEVLDEKSSAEANIRNADKLLTKIQFEQNNISSQILRLEDAIEENNKKYIEVKNSIKQTTYASELASKEQGNLKDKMNKRNEIIKNRARSWQETDRNIGYLEVLFGSSGLNDLFNRLEIVTLILKADTELLKEHSKDQEELIEKQEIIKKGLKDLKSEELELEEIVVIIEEQKKQKDLLIKNLKEKEIAVKEEKRKLNQTLASLAAKEKAMNIVLKHNETIQEHTVSNPTLNIVNYISSSPGMVPDKYYPYYLEAEAKYGIPWPILASLHYIETRYSTHPTMISSAGAIGHYQFMPASWVGYKYNVGGGLVDPSLDITNLDIIKAGNGYGTDGSGDGKADPFNFQDSLASAAKYLASHGFSENPSKAIWHYNHAQWYVDDVLSYAELIKGTSANQNNVSNSVANVSNSVVNVGNKWIGNSVYIFGSGRNADDIEKGKFDCSSFVHWAFNEIGKKLGNLSSVTTDTLKKLGDSVPYEEIQPGDMVFFDTYKKDGHVGIYVGDGKFIGAQGSTGVAIADMSKGYWQEKFNGRVNRIK